MTTCLMGMDLEEEVGDGGWDMEVEEGWALDLEATPRLGPMSAWEEGVCPGVGIS